MRIGAIALGRMGANMVRRRTAKRHEGVPAPILGIALAERFAPRGDWFVEKALPAMRGEFDGPEKHS